MPDQRPLSLYSVLIPSKSAFLIIFLNLLIASFSCSFRVKFFFCSVPLFTFDQVPQLNMPLFTPDKCPFFSSLFKCPVC